MRFRINSYYHTSRGFSDRDYSTSFTLHSHSVLAWFWRLSSDWLRVNKFLIIQYILYATVLCGIYLTSYRKIRINFRKEFLRRIWYEQDNVMSIKISLTYELYVYIDQSYLSRIYIRVKYTFHFYMCI